MDSPFVDIHTHKNIESDLFSYGIHPWRLDALPSPNDEKPVDFSTLESLLKANRLAAIGETGLDRLHKATLSLQVKVFEQHILLSEQYQKPLIIHNVKATDLLLGLHKKHQPSQVWIVHGFNGTVDEVQQFTDRGLCLSVGESIFHQNRKITTSIKSIPLDKLFLETDTSERIIQEVYERCSALINLPLEVLKERIFANFARLKLTTWKIGSNAPGCSLATMALKNLDEATC